MIARPCLTLFAFLSFVVHLHANEDLKIIYERMTDPSFDIAENRRLVPTHSTNISNLTASLEKFNADGSYLTVVPDISESEKFNAESKWDKHKAYLNDVANIAVLYGYNTYYANKISASYNGKAEYKELVYKTLKWYFANHRPPTGVYHQTFSYHDYPDNITGLLGYIGMLLHDDFHTDRLSDASIQKLFEDIVAYNHHVIVDNPQSRGPNWSFRYGNCMRHVVFSNDTAEMNTFAEVNEASIDFDVWAENGTDGVWPDWSLTHHGDMNYWGMYGTSWFVNALDLARILKDTQWEYSTRAIQFMESSVVEGLQWILFHGNTEITTAPKRLTYFLDRTENADEVVAELKKLVALHGDKLKDKDRMISIYNNIDPSWESSTKIYNEVTGHKYFWHTEYQVHRRDNYSIAVRRCSQRARGPEDSANSDIKCHLHFGSGYTSILRRGDEYRLSRLGLDYQTPAGTTTELNGVVSSGKAGSTKRGINLFSGGVEEGGFGAGAFIMNLGEYNNGTWNLVNGAGALKGNFFFENEMVCLGQDIKRLKPGSTEIWTTLNQLQRRGEVAYALDNNEEVSIGLTETVNEPLQFNSKAWFWHDNIGYIITSKKNTKVILKAERRTLNPILMEDNSYRSALSNEDLAAGTINMFQLAINHGSNPQSDTYTYRVIPDVSKQELRQMVSMNGVRILKNSDNVQAVYKPADSILQIVFYEPATLVYDDKSITVDKKAMLQLRQKGSELFVAAANPVHRGLTPSFVSSSSKTIGTLYQTPINITMEGFGIEGESAGKMVIPIQLSVERGYEGKTVSKKVTLKENGGLGGALPPVLNEITINGIPLSGFNPSVFTYTIGLFIDENSALEVLAQTDTTNSIRYVVKDNIYSIVVSGSGGSTEYTVNIKRKGAPLGGYTETFENLVNDGGFMTKQFVGDHGFKWTINRAKYSKHQGTGGAVYVQGGSVESEYIGTGISSFSVSLMNKYVNDGDSTTTFVYFNDSLYAKNTNHTENEVYLLELDSINIPGDFKLRIKCDSNYNKSLVIDNISWTPFPKVKTGTQQIVEQTSKIYPNPCSGIFTVEADNTFQTLEIFSLDGKRIYNQSIHQKHIVDLSHRLPDGIYVLKISGDHKSETHKFCVAH